VKLILHAMHENEVPFINGGEPIPWAPEIPIWLSLVVILGTLVVTTVASLMSDKSKKDPAKQ
jgi:tellurite resistance protein TerC